MNRKREFYLSYIFLMLIIILLIPGKSSNYELISLQDLDPNFIDIIEYNYNWNSYWVGEANLNAFFYENGTIDISNIISRSKQPESILPYNTTFHKRIVVSNFSFSKFLNNGNIIEADSWSNFDGPATALGTDNDHFKRSLKVHINGSVFDSTFQGNPIIQDTSENAKESHAFVYNKIRNLVIEYKMTSNLTCNTNIIDYINSSICDVESSTFLESVPQSVPNQLTLEYFLIIPLGLLGGIFISFIFERKKL